MFLLILLISSELLTPVVLRQQFYNKSKAGFYVSIIIHAIMSLWLWILYFETYGDKGFFDSPRHIWNMMQMTATLAAVVIPRLILIILHFSGMLARHRTGGHIRWMTNTGLAIMASLLVIITGGTLIGRFNFRTEQVVIGIKGLNKDLDGLKIVQISDLHLAGFYHHKRILAEVMTEVNKMEPDLVMNTGDFVTFGWREFDRSDTILSKARGRFGNFAIMGNHDFGLYHPYFTEADRSNNVLKINQFIRSSGYVVLNDENRTISIKSAKIAVIGVTTMGRHPDIIHGDLSKAMAGIDTVDMKILLSHDPNHWTRKVAGKTDIDLTLSGHTHGMQMGIYSKRFKWSPSKYFYPHWSGLFSEGDQYHYVNLGLGVLSIPFRLWMPPEITVITLKQE